MENCLVTKLKATVDNSRLLKPGEMMIKGVEPSLYSDPWRHLQVAGSNIYFKIVNVSDGADIQFCNRQGVKSGTYIENATSINTQIGTDVEGSSCDIIIGNKYSITYWDNSMDGEVDCKDLSWNTLTGFKDIYSNKTYMNELITKNKNDLKNLGLGGYDGSFNLSIISGTTRLTTLEIRGLVNGDIAAIAGNTGLTTFTVVPALANITGDISVFQNTKVASLNFHAATSSQAGKLSLYGDLSTLPPTCHVITLANNPNMGKFTWGGTKSGYRLGIVGASFSSGIDAMLNNQATLDSFTESSSWMNAINVTSDVEPTVAQSVYDAIKTKGINTIRINDISY